MKWSMLFLFLSVAVGHGQLLGPAAVRTTALGGRVKPTVAAAGCTTLSIDRYTFSATDADSLESLSWAADFTAASTSTICKIRVRLIKEGAPSGNIIVGIYNDGGGAVGPTTLVGSSATVAQSTISTSAADVDFTISANLTSGTIYWVAILRSADNNATNRIRWFRTLASTSSREWATFDLGTSSGWFENQASPAIGPAFQLYQ